MFVIHLVNACIASRGLVRIYDILGWMPATSYVDLPLKEVSRNCNQQAVLLYDLCHLGLGFREERCITDHRLNDIDYSAEHQKHAHFRL